MGRELLHQYLKSRAAETPETPEKNTGFQPKPAWIKACTPETPETSINTDSRENFQTRPFGEAVNDPASSEPPALVQSPVTPKPAQALDPDRWCWPHSSAMTGREIDTMVERTALFNRRGLPALEAELLADKLVNRDREDDDRRLCLECVNLSRAGGAMRCNQWQRAGMGAAGIPAGLVLVLQRCDGFKPTR